MSATGLRKEEEKKAETQIQSNKQRTVEHACIRQTKQTEKSLKNSKQTESNRTHKISYISVEITRGELEPVDEQDDIAGTNPNLEVEMAFWTDLPSIRRKR